MPKIVIAGAGGAPSEGVIFSLQQNPDNFVIGIGSEKYDLMLSRASKKYLVPYANDPEYESSLLRVLELEKPDFIHFQNDLEVFHASLLRGKILEAGVKIFMPPHDVIHRCVHKFESYQAFVKAGVPVPKNIRINAVSDLQAAFQNLSNEDGKIWLRSSSIGGGGKGALPTSDFSLAKAWIDHHNGWGDFIAAEMLTALTVTWMSIWNDGELIVAQTRARSGWEHGNRAVSGVTGVTKVGVTVDDSQVSSISISAINSVCDTPHGIFGVDLAYDKNGVPNPTEINISRFFTTIRFFTEAGINFPEISKSIALGENFVSPEPRINPLPSGLYWVRGMDTAPRLITSDHIEEEIYR